jgi:hypothetical protein
MSNIFISCSCIMHIHFIIVKNHWFKSGKLQLGSTSVITVMTYFNLHHVISSVGLQDLVLTLVHKSTKTVGKYRQIFCCYARHNSYSVGEIHWTVCQHCLKIILHILQFKHFSPECMKKRCLRYFLVRNICSSLETL